MHSIIQNSVLDSFSEVLLSNIEVLKYSDSITLTLVPSHKRSPQFSTSLSFTLSFTNNAQRDALSSLPLPAASYRHYNKEHCQISLVCNDSDFFLLRPYLWTVIANWRRKFCHFVRSRPSHVRKAVSTSCAKECIDDLRQRDFDFDVFEIKINIIEKCWPIRSSPKAVKICGTNDLHHYLFSGSIPLVDQHYCVFTIPRDCVMLLLFF